MPQEPVRQLNDPDFEAEMLRLSTEASQAAAHAAAAQAHAPHSGWSNHIEERLDRLEADLRRSAQMVEVLSESMVRVEAMAANTRDTLSLLGDIRDALQRQQTVESANQRLFDALHTELKSYKDSFLLDELLKPLLRDLISFHDDLLNLLDQVEAIKGREKDGPSEEIDQIASNLDHLLVYLIEILERRQVERLPPSQGTADKFQHKIMGSQPVDDPEMQGQILRTLRRGFLWRDKPLRPEQVIVGKISSEQKAEPRASKEGDS
ncbi:MAG: nucleotide exchange factor GrpE [Verrucomicrobiia bacterium]